MVDLCTKRKHDTFNCYDKNLFRQNISKISCIKVPVKLRLHTNKHHRHLDQLIQLHWEHENPHNKLRKLSKHVSLRRIQNKSSPIMYLL
jgi:hypothetical protein